MSLAAIKKLVESGEDVNEVEAAGNTPLHSAAYEGWQEGVELLLSMEAKIDASNNAGDRPYHWAENMGHTDVMDFIVKVCVTPRTAHIYTHQGSSVHDKGRPGMDLVMQANILKQPD